MERLCYGSIAQVLKRCTYYGKTQAKLHEALVSVLDPTGNLYSSTDEAQATNWFKCKNNLSPILLDGLESLSLQMVANNFTTKVFGAFIDPNKIDTAVSVILHIIRNDKKIMPSTVVDLVGKKTKAELIREKTTAPATFLAGVFFYAAKYVKNTDGKAFAPTINEDYINGIIECEPVPMPVDSGNCDVSHASFKHTIWEAIRQDYLSLRREGARFANLSILSSLLPHGYVLPPHFTEYGITEHGHVQPLRVLLDEYENHHVSIIGEGGIGKTTSLMKIMEAVYETEYNENIVVPVFIELNQCTEQIGQWYSTRSKKTNFITRYIATRIQSCELDEVSIEMLAKIEAEFLKQGKTKYLILLDGFNEVSREKAIGKHGTANTYVRELLNNEIMAVMNYPNVRIITTSRKMDMAYFAGTTKNIELTGVKSDDIENYLRDKQFDEMVIKSIKSTDKLMDCLRIPLFLCMYTANEADEHTRPETRGEILYRFFHNAGSIYNERLNARRIKMNSTLDAQQMLFILDFIVPYIGHTMDWADTLSIKKANILSSIEACLDDDHEKTSFWDKGVTAFSEYETEQQCLCDVRNSLLKKGSGEILGCIINTFGIMYSNNESRESLSYHFIHQHIRDYFAGFYEIQRIRLAIAYRREFLDTRNNFFIDCAFDVLYSTNGEQWSDMKQTFVGEIVSEQRNAPVLNKEGKWVSPTVIFKEQHYLKYALDVLRLADKQEHFVAFNIIESIKKVRGNLAGEDFSGLDLTQCRFHGTALSIGRDENRLTASFNGAIISDETFSLEGDGGEVVEFAYCPINSSLFTISEDGTVKHWETSTGRCLRTIRIPNWNYYSYNCALHYFLLTKTEESFLTHGGAESCYVQELSFNGSDPVVYENDISRASIRSMRYSVDDQYVLAVSDYDARENYLHVFKRGKAKHFYKYQSNRDDTLVTALMAKTDKVVLFICTLNLDKQATTLNSRFDLMNIKTGECRTLHTFNAYIDPTVSVMLVGRRVPIFCVNRTNDKIAFINGGFLNEFCVQTYTVKRTHHKIDYMPTFMHYPDFDMNHIICVFEDKVYKYNLLSDYEPQVLLLRDYKFAVKGVFNEKNFLVFDDDNVCYEWNIIKDTTHLKYRQYKMAVLWMFLNNTGTEIIVSFDNDCVIFIDTKTGKLTYAVNLGERDVSSGMCLYDKTRNVLLALLENNRYEFIKSFDVVTCKLMRSYYEFVEVHKIRSIEVATTSPHLLCAFDTKVSLIDLQTLDLTDVYIVNDNEEIRAAHFLENGNIQIVLCETLHSAFSFLGNVFIYEFSKNLMGVYQKSAFYKPPIVPNVLLTDYISGSNITFGIENNGSVDTLCLDAGVFLNQDEALTLTLTIEKHIWDDNNVERIVKYTPKDNEFFYVCYLESFYDMALGESLCAVSDDRSLIVTLALQSQLLSVYKYDGKAYRKIDELLLADKMIDACTIYDETLIYGICSDGKMISINMKTKIIKEYSSYVPGLIVNGCDFRGAVMSDNVRDLLVLHGGIFG